MGGEERVEGNLEHSEAVEVVAASGRRLFPALSQQQARDLAALMLRDLAARGVRLVRDRAGA